MGYEGVDWCNAVMGWTIVMDFERMACYVYVVSVFFFRSGSMSTLSRSLLPYANYSTTTVPRLLSLAVIGDL